MQRLQELAGRQACYACDMHEPAGLSLELAGPGEAARLAQLVELYLHDMSETFPIEAGEDGRFGYPDLASYWTEPDRRFPFLIRAHGRVAGFALVTAGSPASDEPGVHDVAEFFVLRRARRTGVGRAAAFALWDRFPARWTVRVAEANRAGIAFWPGTVSEYCGGTELQSMRAGSVSPVRVFSFASRTPRV
jgi:predicted acetyltransferase